MTVKRSRDLRVLPPEPELPDDWEPRAGVPKRALCRGLSLAVPCPYLECPSHLWPIDAVDRPGRRHANGSGPQRAIRPRSMYTCERDIVAYVRARRPERGPNGELLTYEELGAVLGVSAERVRQIAISGQVHLGARGETLDEYLAAHESAA